MAKKIIVAADDLEDIRRVQAALAEQGYDLVIAMRGTVNPLKGAVEHTVPIGDIENDEQSERFQRRLVTAEYIVAMGQYIPEVRCQLTSDMMAIQGFAELAMEEAAEGSDLRKYLEIIDKVAERNSRKMYQFDAATALRQLQMDNMTDCAAGFECNEPSKD